MSEKIAVIMGGKSLEREVSLASGKQVCEALSALGYDVEPLDITPELVPTLRAEKFDAAFIALHGTYGEDGTIQGVLEFLGIPYTGPGVVSCALTWDKSVAKQLFTENGIDTPAWVTLAASAFKEMGAATAIGLMGEAVGGVPVAVKPNRQGSALGLHRCDAPEQIADALLDALGYDTAAIVERWVTGTEIAVPVLGRGGDLEVLPAVEIVPRGGIFDFQARTDRDETTYYSPARLDKATADKARDVAAAVHHLCDCRDISRVDMVVDADGRPWVLECSAAPGMTEMSLLPMAANAVGMSFQDVVSRAIRSALNRR